MGQGGCGEGRLRRNPLILIRSLSVQHARAARKAGNSGGATAGITCAAGRGLRPEPRRAAASLRCVRFEHVWGVLCASFCSCCQACASVWHARVTDAVHTALYASGLAYRTRWRRRDGASGPPSRARLGLSTLYLSSRDQFPRIRNVNAISNDALVVFS
jgi:hypothetical protein